MSSSEFNSMLTSSKCWLFLLCVSILFLKPPQGSNHCIGHSVKKFYSIRHCVTYIAPYLYEPFVRLSRTSRFGCCHLIWQLSLQTKHCDATNWRLGLQVPTWKKQFIYFTLALIFRHLARAQNSKYTGGERPHPTQMEENDPFNCRWVTLPLKKTNSPGRIDQSHRYGRHQAACR